MLCRKLFIRKLLTFLETFAFKKLQFVFSIDSTEVLGSLYNFKHCSETAVGVLNKKYVQEDII